MATHVNAKESLAAMLISLKKSTEAIMHLASKTLPNPLLFKMIFIELREVPIEEPADPTKDTKVVVVKW